MKRTTSALPQNPRYSTNLGGTKSEAWLTRKSFKEQREKILIFLSELEKSRDQNKPSRLLHKTSRVRVAESTVDDCETTE